MNWLRKLVGRGGDELAPPPPIELNVDARRAQLAELEDALDRLVATMKANTDRMPNPGWRERMAEYNRLSGTAYTLRRGSFTREDLLDLSFEIRPVSGVWGRPQESGVTGDLPEDAKVLLPLEDELMRAAKALQEVLPSEREAWGRPDQ